MKSVDVDEFVSDFSRFYILTILYEGPTHGYSIIKRFRERLGKDISPSLVYPFLERLEQRGLVRHSIKPVGEKDRKVFQLTKEGRKLCGRLFKRFAALVSTAIEPSVNVCAHCGCKVYAGGYTETVDREKIMYCCKHCAASHRKEMEETRRKRNVRQRRTPA